MSGELYFLQKKTWKLVLFEPDQVYFVYFGLKSNSFKKTTYKDKILTGLPAVFPPIFVKTKSLALNYCSLYILIDEMIDNRCVVSLHFFC